MSIRIERRLSQPTLWDAFLHYLAANKCPVPQALLQRDHSAALEPSPEVQRILVEVYKKNPTVSQIAERLVDLDEGFRIMTNIVGVQDPTRDIQCGMRVKLRWHDQGAGQIALPMFEPA